MVARQTAFAHLEALLDIRDHDAARRGREPGFDQRRHRHAEPIEHHRRTRVDGGQLLEDEHFRERAEPVAGGDIEAERPELIGEYARHAARPLVLAQPGEEPVGGEASRRLLDEPLLVGEAEGEHAAPIPFLGVRVQVW